MNVIVSAIVTYEVSGVGSFQDSVAIFQQCVKSVRMVEGVQYIGTKDLFATELTKDGEFRSNPRFFEIEEVE